MSCVHNQLSIVCTAGANFSSVEVLTKKIFAVEMAWSRCYA